MRKKHHIIYSSINFLDKLWQDWLSLDKTFPRTIYFLKFLLFFCIFFLISYQRIDPDFGWHLQAGNYFRSFGIPYHDVFSYTARNFPWIDHEWGNDVIISILYQIGGYVLVALLFGFLWTAALFVNAKKIVLPILWIAAISMFTFSGIRPMIWSILGVAILIRVASSNKTYLRYIIPFGFIVWANLQGGFIVGLAYLLFLLVKERKISWGLIFLVSGLATFINPYGPRLYVEIARTLSDTQVHSQIKEWAYFSIPILSLGYVTLWATGFWLFDAKRLRNWLSFSLFTLAMTLSASRNVPLFVIASLKDFEGYFEKTRDSIPKHLDNVRRGSLVVAAYCLIIICLLLTVNYEIHANDKTSAYPVEAVSYLISNPCPGNLFNSYDYGGYLVWKLPEEPIYIDGRMAAWKDSSGTYYLDRYFAILTTKSAWKKEFKEYDVKCAVLTYDKESSYLISNLENGGWKDTLQANNSILLTAPPNSIY